MNKFAQIIVSIIGLSLFYIWMSSMFQSCQNKSNSENEKIDMVDDSATDEELIDVSDEDFFEDDLDYSEKNEESFEELEQSLTDENTDYQENSASNSNSSSYSSSAGKHMLISGNYLVESNANEMQKKLRNLGYSNAEIVIFDRSQYHTVIASRYSDYNQASRAAADLKQKGIDCYVKTKS